MRTKRSKRGKDGAHKNGTQKRKGGIPKKEEDVDTKAIVIKRCSDVPDEVAYLNTNLDSKALGYKLTEDHVCHVSSCHDDLVQYLEALPCAPALTTTPTPDTPCGQPLLLVLCASALRAVEIIRAMTPVIAPSNTRPAKLFAKHLKASEQTAFLTSHHVMAAVGTPARVAALCAEGGGLDLSRLQCVVFDCHRDAKQATLLSQSQLRTQTVEFVSQHVASLIVTGQTRLAMF